MNNCYCDILKCCAVCNLCTSNQQNDCCCKKQPENKCNERYYECCNVDRCGIETKKKCCEKKCCYTDNCGCQKQYCEKKCVIEKCRKIPCCKIDNCCNKGTDCNGYGYDNCGGYDRSNGCCDKCGHQHNECECNKCESGHGKHCECDKCCGNHNKCDNVIRCGDLGGGKQASCDNGGEWSDFMSINCGGGFNSCEKKQEPKQNDCKTIQISCPKRCCQDVMPLCEYWRNCCK